MTMRRSATAVIERNVTWSGDFATEPWEAAWAGEAIFYVRQLHPESLPADASLTARVQISPDGIRWVDEGGQLVLHGSQELGFVRVREFGGWLRLTGNTATPTQIIAYLSLKE